MRPIKAPALVQQGIAVYVPNVADFTQAKIEIFYSPKNPLFGDGFCDNNPYRIWQKTDSQYGRGILFVYNSPTILPKGFYKILITVVNKKQQRLTGARTIGILKDKPTLHIGTPYSTFGPISLS